MKREKANLKRKLQEKIRKLDFFNKHFDECIEIAEELSVNIRVIVHDTNHSESLLKQLGVKSSIYFYSTNSRSFPCSLVKINGATKTYEPYLDSQGFEFKTFEQWWHEYVFEFPSPIDEDKILYLSRKEVITILANKEGGAHVDADFNELNNILRYKKLFSIMPLQKPLLLDEVLRNADINSNNEFSTFYEKIDKYFNEQIIDGEIISPNEILLYMVRQISHELLQTLKTIPI